jgi:predicted N-acetyltransferase YhbS
MSSIRNYKDEDYEQIKKLYSHSEWFGGQFDEARDSQEKLAKITSLDPESVLVFENAGRIVGTISLIENGRVAWLFRFAVKDNDSDIARKLYKKATFILKGRGHSQVLVYSPSGNTNLDERYSQLGMNKGNDFTAFWKDI